MIAACFRSAPSILPFRPQRPPEVWLPGRLAFRPAYTLLYSLTPGLGGAGVASHTTHACRLLGGLFFLHKMAATENTCCGHVIGKGSLSALFLSIQTIFPRWRITRAGITWLEKAHCLLGEGLWVGNGPALRGREISLFPPSSQLYIHGLFTL